KKTKEEQKKEGQKPSTLITLADLYARPPDEHRWLVKDRLVMSGLSLVAGKPKAGKSTVVRCLALAIAKGDKKWLGGFDVEMPAAPVIYLAFEEKADEVRSHFKMLAPHDEALPIYMHFGGAPTFNPEKWLKNEIEIIRPALVIIDPLFKFLTRVRDGNDYATMSGALQPLLDLARTTNTHICAVHHLGKSDRPDGDDMLGSTSILGIADAALLLKKRGNTRILSTAQRYGPSLDAMILRLTTQHNVELVGAF